MLRFIFLQVFFSPLFLRMPKADGGARFAQGAERGRESGEHAVPRQK